jgi:adenylylsulfate kinase
MAIPCVRDCARTLGFSDEARAENVRRCAEVAKVLASQGIQVICSFITPREHHRQIVRQILGNKCTLVLMDCSLELSVHRDAKGLYLQAAKNELLGMAGTQENFDEPNDSDLRVSSSLESVEACVERVLLFIEGRQ